MHYDQRVFVPFEFVDALWELTERDQRAVEMGNGIFLLLAHVQDEGRLASVDQRFQLQNRDFGDLGRIHSRVGEMVLCRGNKAFSKGKLTKSKSNCG